MPRNHGSVFDGTENIPLDLLLVFGIAFGCVGLNGRDVGWWFGCSWSVVFLLELVIVTETVVMMSTRSYWLLWVTTVLDLVSPRWRWR